jgi:hypothetical protein
VGSYVNPDDLSSLGAVAWNKLRPKVEKASLLQDIYELKDVPGMLKSTKSVGTVLRNTGEFVGSLKGLAKDHHLKWKALGGALDGAWKAAPKLVAEQFLNVSFGWKPFVGSVVKTCDAVLFMEQYIADAERYNNKWQNRRFAEDSIMDESVVYGSYGTSVPLCSPVMSSDIVLPFSCLFEVRRQRMTRVWYEGQFKTYRPQFDKGLTTGYPSVRKLRQMITLLGLDLNATTLYRVTPWTWLVDWFVNVGDNVQSLEDHITDSVAAKYAYIMRSTYDRFEYRIQFKTYTGQVVECKFYKSASVKRRMSADSPFGFTLLGKGFSSFQLEIMAALGLSKAKFGHGR